MGPLNDKNLLQNGENNNRKIKNEKILEILKVRIIINFKTVHYKLTASDNTIQPILKYNLMRPVSI